MMGLQLKKGGSLAGGLSRIAHLCVLLLLSLAFWLVRSFDFSITHL